jgi:DNA polymerase-3 subunit alpha
MSDDSTAGFVHLHVHSSYSLSEGAIKAEKLAALAKEAGMPAVALTDTANLFGALEFAQGCQGKGIQPVMGCQLWLSRSPSDPRPEAERLPPDPIVALAMNARGYDNLQRLSSRSFLGSDASGKPCLSYATLEEHAEGIFLLTGGTLGPVSRLLAEGRREPAEALLRRLAATFPDRLADGAASPRP